MLEKTYAPSEIEPRLYEGWEQSGAFACDPNSPAQPFTIMIPPPNVTGSLHMGHALTFTVQDVLIRWRRMQGRDALWQPGTDHAGIATQMVVERLLAETGNVDRRAMGREAFIERVWQWKAESGGTITRQLRRLGASLDWPRERFTMDEGLSRAVREVFVTLYREGLIYRDRRLVNWDPKLQTAISDLEVENQEVRGSLWYIRYPIADEPGRFIIVATTRPETMLGDTAVAVHPDDARYSDLPGKFAVLPLVGRRIPIVADEYSDPEKGTGAVKITPAHDFNDFEVGRRHGLPMPAHSRSRGARDAGGDRGCAGAGAGCGGPGVRARAGGQGPVRGAEGDRRRTGTAGTVGKDRAAHAPGAARRPRRRADRAAADDAVVRQCRRSWRSRRSRRWKPAAPSSCRSSGRTPSSPGCATSSPGAFRGNCGGVIGFRPGTARTARYSSRTTTPRPQALADAHYGHAGEALVQDEDVLDTWFSSGLWPFSTLGWPEKTPELARYYPGDVLVTGFDIIFFWVARMMMLGIHFMGDVPFRTVYIHGLVRDERGQKMSKSKGNVIDPLELIDRFGADALRFTICALTGPGRDVKLGAARVQDYRSFVTKLWNAARFCEMHGIAPDASFDPSQADVAADPLDSGCGEHRGRGSERSAGGVPLRRIRRRLLPLHLEHVLRLVPGTGQTGLGRRPGRRGGNPRDGGLCAGRAAAAAAPGDPVRYRGVVGSFRLRRAVQPDPRRVAGAGVGAGGSGGARGTRLGGAAGRRGALGADGDERAAERNGADPAARRIAGRRWRGRNAGSSRSAAWRAVPRCAR